MIADRGDRRRRRRRRPHGGAGGRRAPGVLRPADDARARRRDNLRAGLAARRQAPYRQGPRRRLRRGPRHGAEASGRHHRFPAPWLDQAAGQGLRPEGGQLAGPPGRGDAVADQAGEGPCHRPAPRAHPADGRAPQPPSRHRRRPGEDTAAGDHGVALRSGDRDPPRVEEAVPVPRLRTGPHAHRRVVPGGNRDVGLPDARSAASRSESGRAIPGGTRPSATGPRAPSRSRRGRTTRSAPAGWA